MRMRIEARHLGGSVIVMQPEVFEDERGFFLEAYRADQFREIGLPHEYVQDNHSGSVKHVLRGLHFQWEPEMAKLMRVTVGSAFLVAVDIRKGSPTLGQWFGIEASAKNRLQVFAPAGFARGFCVLSDFAEVQYKCTGIYNPNGESGIIWNDERIGIEWPIDNPIVSEKDKKAQTLSEWLEKDESNNLKYQRPES
jgi:dTDP-4-dehydrorhamnose 3,5-epimerase